MLSNYMPYVVEYIMNYVTIKSFFVINHSHASRPVQSIQKSYFRASNQIVYPTMVNKKPGGMRVEFVKKAEFQVFKDITAEELDQCKTMSRADIRKLLESKMNVHVDEGFPQEVLSDFHYHNYVFMTKKLLATHEKTSAFLYHS